MSRSPTSCPRTLPICITRHGRAQAASRGITEEQIKQTIVNGREDALEDKGQMGGYISKFYKTFVNVSKQRITTSKTLVAVCEVFDDKYVVVTCYKEQPRG